MGEKLLSNKAPKIAVEDIVQKVMDIFEDCESTRCGAIQYHIIL